MFKFESGTTLAQFWEALPSGFESDLLDLEADGERGRQTLHVTKELTCDVWIAPCSEGVDRGGYVVWYKLHEVFDRHGLPVVLEAETDGSALLFAGRSTRL